VNQLTTRQTEILEMIAEGLRDRDISDRLGISERTVRMHALRAQEKLNARNRCHAVKLLFHARMTA
jgi:DNA-binding CsgD family transcriptional regulator